MIFSPEADAVSFTLRDLAHETVRPLVPIFYIVAMFGYTQVTVKIVTGAELAFAREVGALEMAFASRGLQLGAINKAKS